MTGWDAAKWVVDMYLEGSTRDYALETLDRMKAKCSEDRPEVNEHTYQELAKRTECNQSTAAIKMYISTTVNDDTRSEDNANPINKAIRLNHSALGLAGEVGELASAVEKWVYYGQDLDVANVKEELGDCLWYIALACNAMGFDLSDVMNSNIAKLRVRYPDKYTDLNAAEENRDHDSEMEKVNQPEVSVGDEDRVQTGQGWAEPSQDKE